MRKHWQGLHPVWRNVILLVIGAWVGMVYLASPGTITKTVDHYHTVTKTVTHTKTVQHIPDSCIKALALGHDLVKSAAKVDSQADQFLDVIGNARVAIEENSVLKLNSIETTMQHYSNRNTAPIMHISLNMRTYNQLATQCQSEASK